MPGPSKPVDWTPSKLTEVSGAYWMGCTLQAGVKLDVFSRIGAETKTAEAIAQDISADLRGVRTLLNALAAMNLLKKKNGRFSNTDFSAVYLDRRSSSFMGHIVLHHYHLVPAWARLDQAVRTGLPHRFTDDHSMSEMREGFIMGMFNIAIRLAPEIVEAVDLSDRRHLLDLGGGPGTYGIHFCLKNPELRATIYDLPTTRPFAERTIARFDLSDRIDFQEGDYTAMGIEGRFDAVWMSHVLHAEGPRTCRKIIDRAASTLISGGIIIIHDFILDDTMDRPLFPALFGLNMLVNTDQGQAYCEREICEMLADAGLHRIQRLDYQGPTGNAIVRGVR